MIGFYTDENYFIPPEDLKRETRKREENQSSYSEFEFKTAKFIFKITNVFPFFF